MSPGARSPKAIVGLNRMFEHGGQQYLTQVEDLGEGQACFEVRVHIGGGVVWQKKALHTGEAAIARGKLLGPR